uniref:PEROXIDASE_4 domain-containing protein n=1 Tax=Haemonchus placei TaxID=6290 RepID=A0A0N4WKP8_HAEPC
LDASLVSPPPRSTTCVSDSRAEHISQRLAMKRAAPASGSLKALMAFASSTINRRRAFLSANVGSRVTSCNLSYAFTKISDVLSASSSGGDDDAKELALGFSKTFIGATRSEAAARRNR